ncbi:MAG: hypothetical protein SVM79_07200 [Chloroflexota bacterium]|nr:hypothetical protein [Chloroflexota bacterium]
MNSILQELEVHVTLEHLQLLRKVGETAWDRGERLYLVGGAVRDFILAQPNSDLDLVVEGKAIPLARQIAKAGNWEIKTHPRFGTAKLSREGYTFDLVSSRSETYPRPGALPEVKPGTLQDDLARRDFTINAMAVSLAPPSFGELFDPHGGRNDLKQKQIRVLHDDSFSDDPTRIFRALRYEQRLGFRLEPETEIQLLQSLDNLDTMTGERLWHELELILRESQPERAILRVDEIGALRKLCPAFTGDDVWLADKFVQVRKKGDASLSWVAVYLALFTYWFDSDETEACISRLKFPGWATRIARDSAKLKQTLPDLAVTQLRPSQIYRKLEHHLPEVVAAGALAAESDVARKRMELYLSDLRHISTWLNGDDLQSMGVSPGKTLGQILRSLHEANLDRKVISRADEEQLVRDLM